MTTAASDARTIWRAKPCGWRDRERVVALGEEFGPAGPLVLDVLEELAKEQRVDGAVRTGLRALTRAAFLPRGQAGLDLAREILTFGAKVGAIDDLHIGEDVELRVTCRVSGYVDDQGRGYEAVKRARSRAATSPGWGDAVPVSGTASRSVPESPSTGQDRTGKPPSPPQAGGQHQLGAAEEETAPIPPSGARRRQQKAFEQQLQDFTARHFPGLHPGYVRDVASMLRRRRVEPTAAALRPHLARYQPEEAAR